MKRKVVTADSRKDMLIAYIETADDATVHRLYELLIPVDDDHSTVNEEGTGFWPVVEQAELEADGDAGLSWEETVKEMKKRFENRHK